MPVYNCYEFIYEDAYGDCCVYQVNARCFYDAKQYVKKHNPEAIACLIEWNMCDYDSNYPTYDEN